MKATTFALAGLTAVFCLGDSSLEAWTRKPMDTNRCTQEGKDLRRCKKENTEDNSTAFASLLSPEAFKYYNDFSPQEKQQAMDYADNNAMSPNDAVFKVNTQPARG
jgi:hypothetical protein